MTSARCATRSPDHLITPQNAALLLIDRQPAQLAAIHSMDHALLLSTSRSTTAAAPSHDDPGPRPGHR